MKYHQLKYNFQLAILVRVHINLFLASFTRESNNFTNYN